MNRSASRSDFPPEGRAIDEQDRVLVARIAAGNEEAMTELYGRHGRRIHAFALSRLGDPVAAADVVSETLVEVWRGAGRFAGRSRVTTWMLGIARHKLLDELRRRATRAHEELDDALADPDARDPGADLDGAGARTRLQQCLARLGAAHREAIHLAFFEDLSCGEIAEVAGIPVGTVKTRLFHARRWLRRCVEGGSEEGADA